MATVEVVTNEGELVNACESGKLEDVRRLLLARVDPNTRSSNRLFVLHLAANSGHLEVCRLLLNMNASVNARDSADFCPLHYAAYHGKFDVIKLLRERGADMDSVGSNGSSPLHLASAGDSKAIVEYLLACGAQPDRKNQRFLSPADLARSEPVRSILEQASRPVSLMLQVICQEESRDVTKELTINTTETVGRLRSMSLHLFGLSHGSPYQISIDGNILVGQQETIISRLGLKSGAILRVVNEEDIASELALCRTKVEQLQGQLTQALTENGLRAAEVLEEQAKLQACQSETTTAQAATLRNEARALRAEALLQESQRKAEHLQAAVSTIQKRNEILEGHSQLLDRKFKEEQVLRDRLREADARYRALQEELEACKLDLQIESDKLKEQLSIVNLMQTMAFKERQLLREQSETTAVTSSLVAQSPLAAANFASAPDSGDSEGYWKRVAMRLSEELKDQALFVIESGVMKQCGAISDFTINRSLGCGNNGMVFEVFCTAPRHPNVHKKYALKMCFNFDLDTAAASGAFIQEFQELSKMPSHRNVVKCYSGFVDEIRDCVQTYLPDWVRAQSSITNRAGEKRNRRTQYIVLEHLENNLKNFINVNYPVGSVVPQALSATIICQLASALMHLELYHIAHRDLKLDNILVETDRDDSKKLTRCVLSDFGSACQLDDQKHCEIVVSETGYILSEHWGNPLHIAPELHTQAGRASRQKKRQVVHLDYCFQYSFELAVVAYEIILGDVPLVDYPGVFTTSSGEVNYKDSDIQSIPSEALQPELASILKAALSREPERRPTLAEIYTAFLPFVPDLLV